MKKQIIRFPFSKKEATLPQICHCALTQKMGWLNGKLQFIFDTKVTYCVNQLIIFLHNQSTYWTGITANVGSLLEQKSRSMQYKKITEVYIDQYGGSLAQWSACQTRNPAALV